MSGWNIHLTSNFCFVVGFYVGLPSGHSDLLVLTADMVTAVRKKMVYCYNFFRPFVIISLYRCCSLLSHVTSEYDSVEGCVRLYSYPFPSSCNCTSAGSGVLSIRES